MRVALLSIALLFSLPAMASEDIFTYGSCQTLTPIERARIEVLDATYTEKSAKEAMKELSRRMSASMQDAPPPSPSSGRLTALVGGWLAKKDWLSARVRHDHDADEGTYYCGILISHAKNNNY